MQKTCEQVVLVNDEDGVIGTMDKLETHRKGLLHRAISVWITDSRGRVLIQQRAATKYHSPNLWANACCGHPKEGELIHEAALRRMREELGIQCPLQERSSFIYRADVGQGLIEHELDHLFVGQYEGAFSLNPDEVSSVKYLTMAELRQALAQTPDIFGAWFPYVYAEVMKLQ